MAANSSPALGDSQGDSWEPAKGTGNSKHMLKHGAICPIISNIERATLNKIINCVLGFKLDPFFYLILLGFIPFDKPCCLEYNSGIITARGPHSSR